MQKVFQVGPAPPVDALIVVSDHADIAVFSGKKFEQLVLSAVGVLKLIH